MKANDAYYTHCMTNFGAEYIVTGQTYAPAPKFQVLVKQILHAGDDNVRRKS